MTLKFKSVLLFMKKMERPSTIMKEIKHKLISKDIISNNDLKMSSFIYIIFRHPSIATSN